MTTQISNSQSAYAITVNYDLSVEDAVRAGHYEEASEELTSENFPSLRTGTTTIELILINFHDEMGFERVVHQFDEMGLRVAELPELLAYGAQHPKEPYGYEVVALGSVLSLPKGLPAVPHIDGNTLVFSYRYGKWNALARFAAVRE
jgi:hypothetical protein